MSSSIVYLCDKKKKKKSETAFLPISLDQPGDQPRPVLFGVVTAINDSNAAPPGSSQESGLLEPSPAPLRPRGLCPKDLSHLQVQPLRRLSVHHMHS